MKTVAAAIEFGTSKIVTLLAESSGLSSSRCNIVGSGAVPYAGYVMKDLGELLSEEDGQSILSEEEAQELDGQKVLEWNDPDELFYAIEESIRTAESEAKRSIRDIYVGVPCECIFVRTAVCEVDVKSPDGRITPEDISSVMDAAADELNLSEMGYSVLHRSPAWFVVENGKRTMQPQNYRGKKLQAMVSFIVADTKFIEDIRSMLGNMGITVNAFLAPTLGAAMLLVPFDERDRNPVVLIDVGYLNTELSIVEGDGITFHAVLPMGGVDITLALSQDLGIGMNEAETIKRKYNFTPDEIERKSDFEVRYADGTAITLARSYIQNSIEGECGELISMIDQTLDYAKDHINARSPIYLTGGGLRMRGCKEYMGEKLGYGVKMPVSRAARLNHPRFASTLGLMDLVFDIAGRWNAPSPDADSTASGFTKIFRGQKK